MKKILYIIGGVVLVIILIAIVAGDSDTGEPTRVDREDTTEEDVEENGKVASEIFSIGETIAMGELEFTVNSARWDHGDQFMGPDSGEKWLAIDVTIENLSDESTVVSSIGMFDLVDSEGYSKDMEIFAETKGSLDGELGAGRRMRGEIAFNVEEGQEEWEFIFSPNFFGFGQAIFSISSEEVS